jgi:hypothetical protein
VGYSNRGRPTGIDSDPKDLASLAGQVKDLALFLEDEFGQIASSLNDLLQLRVSFVAPPKPRQGMVVFADGTHWNPGLGEGVYVFKSDLTWHLLG